MKLFRRATLVVVASTTSASVFAQTPAFQPGPVFFPFGNTAPAEGAVPIPNGTVFRHSFDVSVPAAEGPNRGLDSAARFINMHVRAGMPRESVRVAVVIHGPASFDLTREDFYRSRKDGKSNASAALVTALLAQGVDIYLCGQSGASLNIKKADLLPGVKVTLSAMTAHALLQQQGYTLNPF